MLVVVGGHSRRIGKTAVAAGLIRRLRDRRWTAVKITQYGHGVCSSGGGRCGCASDCESGPERPFALSEEYEPGRTDSGRFLAAGAERSFWLRTRAGELGQAADALRKLVKRSRNLIVESNSVLDVLKPDVCLMVMDFSSADFKASSARFLDRVDAYVVIDRGQSSPLWEHAMAGIWGAKPQFPVRPPDYVTEAVADFVGARVAPPAS